MNAQEYCRLEKGLLKAWGQRRSLKHYFFTLYIILLIHNPCLPDKNVYPYTAKEIKYVRDEKICIDRRGTKPIVFLSIFLYLFSQHMYQIPFLTFELEWLGFAVLDYTQCSHSTKQHSGMPCQTMFSQLLCLSITCSIRWLVGLSISAFCFLATF